MMYGKVGKRVLAWALCMAIASSFASAEETKPRPADTAALVNGATISRRELDAEVLKFQKTLLGFGRPLSCRQIDTAQSEVLEGLIRRELLTQESRRSGIKPDAESVKQEIEGLRKQFVSDADYKKELTRRGLSEDALRKKIEDNLVVQQYVDGKVRSKVTVSDSEMVAFYENRVELFKQPLQIAASHILIQVDPKGGEIRKKAAKKKAEQILMDLKKGADFNDLAREHSDGPTRTSGGDLGYVRIGQLDQPLENVVFNMKPGQLSDLVETSYGYHIFKVTDRKPETILAYDTVKEQIRQQLKQEKMKQEADLFAKTLREKAQVEIFVKDEINTATQQ